MNLNKQPRCTAVKLAFSIEYTFNGFNTANHLAGIRDPMHAFITRAVYIPATRIIREIERF